MNDLYFQNDNVKIHVHDYDNPGDAVIFLHFSGANLMMWQRALPFFLDKFRVILVDDHSADATPEILAKQQAQHGDTVKKLSMVRVAQ